MDNTRIKTAKQAVQHAVNVDEANIGYAVEAALVALLVLPVNIGHTTLTHTVVARRVRVANTTLKPVRLHAAHVRVGSIRLKLVSAVARPVVSVVEANIGYAANRVVSNVQTVLRANIGHKILTPPIPVQRVRKDNSKIKWDKNRAKHVLGNVKRVNDMCAAAAVPIVHLVQVASIDHTIVINILAVGHVRQDSTKTRMDSAVARHVHLVDTTVVAAKRVADRVRRDGIKVRITVQRVLCVLRVSIRNRRVPVNVWHVPVDNTKVKRASAVAVVATESVTSANIVFVANQPTVAVHAQPANIVLRTVIDMDLA